jgi:hypothetical protein
LQIWPLVSVLPGEPACVLYLARARLAFVQHTGPESPTRDEVDEKLSIPNFFLPRAISAVCVRS